MEDLAAHGITMKPEMQGLTDEQIRDLNLGTKSQNITLQIYTKINVTWQRDFYLLFFHERLRLSLLPEMGKHPDLLVAHLTSTIFTTIGRNYEIS